MSPNPDTLTLSLPRAPAQLEHVAQPLLALGLRLALQALRLALRLRRRLPRLLLARLAKGRVGLGQGLRFGLGLGLGLRLRFGLGLGLGPGLRIGLGLG